REDDLRVGALPEQEVAQPLLAAGADQQVDLRRALARGALAEDASQRLPRARLPGPQAQRRPRDRLTRRVVERDPQVEPPPCAGRRLGALDRRDQRSGQAVPTADDADAHALARAPDRLAAQGPR